MTISLHKLTQNDTAILKGIGILLIVMHNFLHWTNDIGENEMVFDNNRIFLLIESVLDDPFMIINGFFTYFGFFGIEIFIFISGYGLAKQFMRNKPASYFRYIVPRLIKIYGLLLFGLISYFNIMYPIGAIPIEDYLSLFISSCLLYNNFTFDTIFLYPMAGPFWYFSFIIQLYIIFPILYYVIDKYKEKGMFGMIIISYIIIYILLYFENSLKFPVFGNFIGHLPEFILAMGFAMFKQFRLNYKIILPVAVLFILSNFYATFFPFSFISATILMLYFLYPLFKVPAKITKPIIFIGGISMIIFILNPPLRIWTRGYTYGQSSEIIFLISLIHLSLVLLVSYLTSIIYNKLYSPILNKIINYTRKQDVSDVK